MFRILSLTGSMWNYRNYITIFQRIFRSSWKIHFIIYLMPDKYNGTSDTFFYLLSEISAYLYINLTDTKINFMAVKKVYVKGYLPPWRDYDMEGNFIRFNKDVWKIFRCILETLEFGTSTKKIYCLIFISEEKCRVEKCGLLKCSYSFIWRTGWM